MMVPDLGSCLAKRKSLVIRAILHSLSSLRSYLEVIILAKVLPNFQAFLSFLLLGYENLLG